MSAILTRLNILTAGESHGPKLTAILEGGPAGFPIDAGRIGEDLAERQKGFGSGGRMKIEKDEARITAGVMAGLTTGGPIALEIANLDFKNWRDREIPPMTTPRPGHADLTGAVKYGHRDLRLALERASARETAARVAIGSVLKQMIEAFGVEVGGYVRSIGKAEADLAVDSAEEEYRRRFADAKKSELKCPDKKSEAAMRDAVSRAIEKKDTLGGVIEVAVLFTPPGLGSYVTWDRRLEARLAMALMSVQAIKGVEVGPGFENASKMGTEVHDEIFVGDDGKLFRKTNRAGGIEGGVTNGDPIVIRAAMKPIATTLTPLSSVDLASFEPQAASYERSDICAVPRAVPVCEAMTAIVVADALFEKLGGDSFEEMKPRFEKLARAQKGDFSLANVPWKFKFEG